MKTEYHIDQIGLICAISKYLAKAHKVKAVLPRQYNAMIRAADIIVEEFAQGEKVCPPGGGILRWLASDRTGTSSLFMAWTMGCGPQRYYAHPHDAGDFARCLGLLEACPELRERLPLMRSTSEVWVRLTDEWDALASLYASDTAACSKRILAIESEITP